jgi:hypothetical protein
LSDFVAEQFGQSVVNFACLNHFEKRALVILCLFELFEQGEYFDFAQHVLETFAKVLLEHHSDL